ncbi:MAG: S41 family peptidase [Bacteroidetes bacterium]|nr:MAG: S41 family peptidase [Bacteroidota bacterium]
MKNLNIKSFLPFIFAIVLALGVLLGLNLNFERTRQMPSEKKFFTIGFDRYDKINDIINYVYESYVDTINRQELTEETIISLLRNLDPHSSYIPASAFQALNDPLMGSFEGIGIEFNMMRDTVVVINPIPGGPSETVGLRAGDRIIKVEGETIAGVNMGTQKVVGKLKGPKGTKVTVSVMRRGVDELVDFTITRDKIPSYSLDIAYMIDEKTGYIKLGQFSATTHQEFQMALDRLKRQGMEQMILDLRGNGGGFLDAAIQLADEFLKPESLIVYTDGRRRPKTVATARRNGGFETQPLVVLIDEWSASASEIIAGAVQDHDRGLIIGRRSFGKGLVQEQVQLSDGSAMRLTVARYYTPSGRSIQKPYDNGTEEYFAEFMQRYLDGELEHPDSIKFDDSLRFETAAGRIVYGGGGITPDIFIPLNTQERSPYFVKIANRGLIYRFAFDYADDNRDRLRRFDTADNFMQSFSVDNQILRSFIDFASKEGVDYNEAEFRTASGLIQAQIKAYIGRNIFGNDAFYPVMNQRDPAIAKALEVLQSETLLTYLAPLEKVEIEN